MTKEAEEGKEEVWKKFLGNHWKFCIIVLAGIIIALIGGVFVFLWRVGAAPAALGTPANIGDWTVGYIISFILDILFWEFLIVGIPIIAAVGVIILQWWNKLPEEEKEEYKREPRQGGTRRGITIGGSGSLISLLVTINWLIIVWVRGYWNTAFSAWAFSAFVNTVIWAFLWILILFGVPITILIILWLRREYKREET